MSNQPEKCLAKGCNNDARSRGLCATCRQVLDREIEAGVITMEDAIEQGLIKAKRQGRTEFRKQIATAAKRAAKAAG